MRLAFILALALVLVGGCTAGEILFQERKVAEDTVYLKSSPYGDGQAPEGSGPYGYQYLDNGSVVQAWNPHLTYYFNKTSGLQYTNNYDEYWSQNVFCLGWLNSSGWNYKCNDVLLNFTWNIETDNLTYVRATGFRDTTIQEKDIRIGLRYELNESFEDLAILPYVENRDSTPITNKLRFIYKAKEIQAGNTVIDNVAQIGWKWTLNLSNQSLIIFNSSNMTNGEYFVEETNNFEWFGLKWDGTLDWKLQVAPEAGQYNSPITLALDTTGLGIGKNKSTQLLWKDAVCGGLFGNDSKFEPMGRLSIINTDSYYAPGDRISDGIFDFLRFTNDNTTIEKLTCYQNGLSCPTPVTEGPCAPPDQQGYLECIMQFRFSGASRENQSQQAWNNSAGWTEEYNSPVGLNCDTEFGSDHAEVNNYALPHDRFTDIRCRVRTKTWNQIGEVGACNIQNKGTLKVDNWWANNHTPTAENITIRVQNISFDPNRPHEGHNLTCEYDFSDKDGDAENKSQTHFNWTKNGVEILPRNYSQTINYQNTTPGDRLNCSLIPVDVLFRHANTSTTLRFNSSYDPYFHSNETRIMDSNCYWKINSPWIINRSTICINESIPLHFNLLVNNSLQIFNTTIELNLSDRRIDITKWGRIWQDFRSRLI